LNDPTDQKEEKCLSVDTVLFNAKVYTSQGIVEAGIAIDNERIIKIAKETNLPQASTRLNMNDCLVLPGLIDSHVHLRDQQLAYREDFTTGTAAAVAGGVTTVIDMPNNKPITMDTKSLRERMQLAEKRILVNVAFNSALPHRTEEIQHIVNEGAVGFKLYLIQQIGGVNIDDENALERIFKAIAETKVPIAVHAEDKTTLEEAKKKIQKAGRSDAEAFQEAHPPNAEVKAIKRATGLAQNSGAHIHVCHISSAAGLKTIQKTKRTSINVTCEVTPHHLLLTAEYLKKKGNLALMLPPLRTKTDNEMLWKALRQGSIDTVASDHAPHSMEEKTAQSIWDVKPGIAGLETTLPLMLTEVNKKHLTIADLVRLTSEKPAEIFHIKDRGSLKEGCFADIVVVDINREHKIDASRFKSKAKFSPFDGWKVKGKPVKTFVNGQLVMKEGEIVAKPGTGRIIR
jgi:dihydroorotase (multifunctional complex type)